MSSAGAWVPAGALFKIMDDIVSIEVRPAGK
jgi:hypothetical protein